jgi:hypothetical protein
VILAAVAFSRTGTIVGAEPSSLVMVIDPSSCPGTTTDVLMVTISVVGVAPD